MSAIFFTETEDAKYLMSSWIGLVRDIPFQVKALDEFLQRSHVQQTSAGTHPPCSLEVPPAGEREE
jgi:hypothetical protein